jgi:serine/threonine protein kinase
MSPEQARGETVDARSDLFGLGSVIYAMCSGRPPFRAESSYGILRRITDTEPRPIQEINPDVPDWLAAIAVKLHAKDATERFSSADELAGLLEQCLAHVQQPTVVPLPDQVRKLVVPIPSSTDDSGAASSGRSGWLGRRLLGRRALVTGGMAAIVLVVVAIVGLAIMGWPDAGRQGPGVAPRHVGDGPRDTVSGSSPETASDDSSPSSAWRDTVEGRILEMERDFDRFEEGASRLWEDDVGPRE